MHGLDMQSRSYRCYKSHDFSQGNTEEKSVIFIKDAQGFPFSSFRFIECRAIDNKCNLII